MRLIALLALCVCTVVSAASLQRIIGGSVTTINSYPHAAALLYSATLVSYAQFCAGTIINQRSILTAAHCFHDDRSITERWRIRVGSTFAHSGGAVHNVAQVIVHPNYNIRTSDSDVAILKSTSTINLIADTVQPGLLAGTNYNLGDNEVVWAVGWGITENGRSSEQLRHVQIWTVSQDICRQRYIMVGITDNMLCSGWLDIGGRDQCNGDSGGPLHHNGVVVAICSFGYGCGDPRYPGVSSRVSPFADWIRFNA